MDVHARRLLTTLCVTALLALSVQPFAGAEGQTAPTASPAAAEASAEAGSPAGEISGEAPDSSSPESSTPASGTESSAPEESSQTPETGVRDTAAPEPVAVSEQPAQAPTGRRIAGVDCPPQDQGDSITSITVAPTVVTPNQAVTVTFTGVLPNGGCDGDYIRIPVPPELRGFTGTFPVNASDGTTIATMVVTGTEVLMTFNSYLESHSDVRFSGFVLTQVRSTVVPDTTYDLHWPVGEGFDTPVVTPPCDNCNAGGVGSRKFAVYEAGPPPYVRWAISSRVTQTVGETVVITDTVGDGHSLDCTSLRVRLATSVDAWGHPEFSSNYFNYTVDSCSDTTLQVTITATAVGQFFQLQGDSNPTVVQPSYVDSGTVTQQGTTDPVRATARASNGGGQVVGNLRKPKITIQKWSTNQGMHAGDHDTSAKRLNPNRAERLTFTITNTGNERLRDIVVSDKTSSGRGVVRHLSCDFSRLGGPATGTRWAGSFLPGERFTCTGVLPPLGRHARHTDIASVTAIGAGTRIQVAAKDPWKAWTPGGRGPAIDIEKWSTDKGPRAGDHDGSPAHLEPSKDQSISFTITNTGAETLRHVVVRDRTIAGVGRVRNVTCDFSPLGGPDHGTTWAGPFEPGEHFQCVGVLNGLLPGQHHTDVASVTGIGIETGITVRDRDRWLGVTTGAGGSTGLPDTGIGARVAPVGLLGLLSLAGGVILLRRQRRADEATSG